MTLIADMTSLFYKLAIKKKSRKFTKPARFLTLTVETPLFCDLEDVESATPKDVISFAPRANTARVPNFLKLPNTFPIISVQVPTEDEKDMSPDLPAQVFDVYEGLPTATDWGATGRMAVTRLEHLRLLDHMAYKKALAKGLKTPMPPKMRV